jgi:hypothetical protein
MIPSAHTSNITVGDDELAVLTNKGIGGPDGFVEKTGKLDVEAFRASAVHHEIGICDVTPVVRRVDVLAIPAGREHDLESNAIGAIGVKIAFLGEVVAVQRSLGVSMVVQAIEAESSLLEIGLSGLSQRRPDRLLWVRLLEVEASDGVVAPQAVSRNHAKAGWERLDAGLRVGVVLVEKIIIQHATHLIHELVSTNGMTKVERRRPVNGLVLDNTARSALCGHEVVVGGIVSESCRALSASGSRKEAVTIPEEPWMAWTC